MRKTRMSKDIFAADLDGVIFDFNTPYRAWINGKFGCQIPEVCDSYPDTWNYATDGGYITKDQEREFWKWACGDGNYIFWRNLPAYAGAKEFLRQANQRFKEIYFVTSRPGPE